MAPSQVDGPADDVHLTVAHVRLHRHARVALGRQHQDVGEKVVETTTVATDHDDPRRRQLEGAIERELEIGLVLGHRMTLDGCAGRGGRGQRLGRDGVEVADDHIDGLVQGERSVQSGVGCDHVAVVGQPRDDLGPHRIAAGEHDHGGTDARDEPGSSGWLSFASFISASSEHERTRVERPFAGMTRSRF